MGLKNVLQSIINYKTNKEIKIDNLPSKGKFYPPNTTINIKKASENDIKNYKSSVDNTNLLSILYAMVEVVKNNIETSLIDFKDIKALDLLYIFLKIVEHTKSKNIKILYNKNNEKNEIIFNHKNFNYFDYEKYEKYYNKEKRLYEINGFKYSLPSIGLQLELNIFLSNKSDKEIQDFPMYFLFFTSNKKNINQNFIENYYEIIQKMSDEQKVKAKKVIKIFKDIGKYELKKGNDIVDINSINYEKIWDYNK